MFMSLCSYVWQFTLEHNDISVQILMSLCRYVASVNQALWHEIGKTFNTFEEAIITKEAKSLLTIGRFSIVCAV